MSNTTFSASPVSYGVKPETYGEAAKLRINNQGAAFRNNNPNGSTEQPRANYPDEKKN